MNVALDSGNAVEIQAVADLQFSGVHMRPPCIQFVKQRNSFTIWLRNVLPDISVTYLMTEPRYGISTKAFLCVFSPFSSNFSLLTQIFSYELCVQKHSMSKKKVLIALINSYLKTVDLSKTSDWLTSKKKTTPETRKWRWLIKLILQK